jgi:hypothetical protein
VNTPPIRVAPDHALDVGVPTDVGVQEGNNDAVRAVYGADYSPNGTCPSPGPVVLRTLHCDLTLTNCSDTERWGTNPNPGGNPPSNLFEFSPNVQQSLFYRGWAVTWLRAFGNQVDNMAAEMGTPGGQRALIRQQLLIPTQTACLDPKSPAYWGDYDDLKLIGAGCGALTDALGFFPMYVKGFTDSRADPMCSTLQQHVGAVTFFE